MDEPIKTTQPSSLQERLAQGPNQIVWCDEVFIAAPNLPPSERPAAPAAVALFVSLVVSLLVVTAGLLFYNKVVAPSQIPPIQLAGDGSLDIQALVSKAEPSVVTIRAGQAGTTGTFSGSGSGVIISEDGLILTNAHVIRGAARATVLLSDTTELEARLVGSFPNEDIAVLQIVDPPPLTPAMLGNSNTLQVGEPVIAMGNALDLGGSPTVTLGIVSALNRNIAIPSGDRLQNLVQTDAAINPGNSGGPLLNAAGQVVAINTAIASDAEGIGFAIAIDSIKPLVEEIENGGGTVRADQAFVGLLMENLDKVNSSLQEEFPFTEERGVFVIDVVLDSTAFNAGVRRGDILVAVDGKEVSSPQEAADIVRKLSPGSTTELRVVRGGEVLNLSSVVKTREDSAAS